MKRLVLAAMLVLSGCGPKAPPPPPCALQVDLESTRAEASARQAWTEGALERIVADAEQADVAMVEEIARLRAELRRCGCKGIRK